MRRPAFILCALGLTALLTLALLHSPAAPPPQVIAPTDPLSPEDERKSFHVPPGFEVELVAAEPAIHKPINLNFDDRGRLWLTDTVEYPFPAPPDRKPRDTVKVLEDTQGNGVFDKVTTFADGLNIPIGVLPTTDGCWAFSIPNVYHFSDTKGTGQADKRDLLYGVIGEAVMKDTHGMTGNFTPGFDGWVYATHGFSNASTVKTADGAELKMHSGNIYRVKSDGSRAEWWSHGQVNPFGMCFDPLGNLYSADCETKPLTLLLRGAYYQSFGKPHDGMGFGPEMCDHKHGSTAIAGIVYYAADHFPPAYRDTMFLGNVVTNRINHDRLAATGSTYRAIEQPDFLVSDDPWFRPVDVKLGPDGALYVADFYNKIIGHYEVDLKHPGRDKERGRIWRIVYKGPDGKGKPHTPRDLTKAGVPELVDDLADPNLTLRMQATDQLVHRDKDAVAELVGKVMQPRSNAWQRVQGLWVLERIGRLSEANLIAAAQDSERAVRIHAMRVLAERAELNPTNHQLAVDGLRDSDAFVQRAAADALGRHPSADNLRPLLDLRHTAPAADAQLVHTLRLALRDQLRTPENWKTVAALSEGDARAIADVSLGVHLPEAAAFLIEHLAKVAEPGDAVKRYVHHAARYIAADLTPKLVAWLRARNPDDLRQQVDLLQEFLQGTQERGAVPSEEARAWATQIVGKLVAAKEADLLQRGAELAGALRLESVRDPVLALAKRKDLPDNARRAALTALVNLNVEDFAGILGTVLAEPSEALAIREHAALILGGLNQPPAVEALVKVLPTVPARLQVVVAAALAGNKTGAEPLLKAVAEGKASARLLKDKNVEARLFQSGLPEVKERLAKLTQGLPATDPKVAELIGKRRAGFVVAKADAKLGAEVFAKNCANCHQVGGKGGKVGPQLDGAGNRGLDRILEDVLDPNANVDQAFRASVISLKNGQLVTGLVLREEGEVLVVADAQGKEVRVSKGDVEERTVSLLSPMPANMGEQIPEAEFYHLIAYLLTQQPPPDVKK